MRLDGAVDVGGVVRGAIAVGDEPGVLVAGDDMAGDDAAGEDAAPAHVRVWGAALPLGELLAIDPMPGEDHHGTGSRLGALAARVWLPLLGAIR